MFCSLEEFCIHSDKCLNNENVVCDVFDINESPCNEYFEKIWEVSEDERIFKTK